MSEFCENFLRSSPVIVYGCVWGSKSPSPISCQRVKDLKDVCSQCRSRIIKMLVSDVKTQKGIIAQLKINVCLKISLYALSYGLLHGNTARV